MEKIILLLFLTIPAFCIGQNATKWQYCEIVAQSKLMSKKVTISIDYGEESSFWKWNPEKDEEGKKIVFNTAVDALNYMGDQGWEVVGFSNFTASGVTTYKYLMKRFVEE